MDKVDQFESAFRSAAKDVFHYRRRSIASMLVVTDLRGAAAQRFTHDVRAFTAALGENEDVHYVTIEGDRFESPKDLLEIVDEQRPDMIVTYRCLHSEAWRWVFTLGAHVDVLTQATTTPVLLLPHPTDAGEAQLSGGSESPGLTDRVMAVTDHLTGDERLINAALTFAEPHGTLVLSHVEDDATFDRYMQVIGRIPEIDTDLAEERIKAQLLKEPADFIRSVAQALRAAGVACELQDVVLMGHHVKQYRDVIEAHEIDLLVLNTKDEESSAMHGLAYPLAVELRDTPLLLL
jgi:hypothetical protein